MPLKINEMQNVGHAKYVVNYCTGKTYSDGSDFYDIAIFKNRAKKDEFVRQLTNRWTIRLLAEQYLRELARQGFVVGKVTR